MRYKNQLRDDALGLCETVPEYAAVARASAPPSEWVWWRGSNAERNWGIFQAVVFEGKTFKEVGAEYGVSGNRARQIAEKVSRICKWCASRAKQRREEK